MSELGHVAISGVIVVAWTVVLQGRRALRETTLISAWIWAFVAASVWTLSWLLDSCFSVISPQLADHAWYASTVLSLCPLIAVLGSRRPGARVWTWFILLPMLFALGWPVIALTLQGTELRGLQLETPQLAAFCLVLVMGVGNYCGTRFTITALLYGIALLAIVVSTSAMTPRFLSNREQIRFWSTAAIAVAVCLIPRSSRPTPSSNFDRLWLDFFDTFGIVWGRRIQDRVNYIAKKEGLAVQLELEGFVWKSTEPRLNKFDDGILPKSLNESSMASHGASGPEIRIEYILRWLLRRFVDPGWIDRRLGSTTEMPVVGITVDS